MRTGWVKAMNDKKPSPWKSIRTGLIALLEVHEKEELINDRYVAILTGKY